MWRYSKSSKKIQIKEVHLSMLEIEISEVAEIIDNAPSSMNLMFLGDTGIGKTTAVEQYCKSHGIYLKTLILSQLDASESLGIPVKSSRMYMGKEYQCITTAVPDWVFELAEQPKCMLFLDEFLCAQPSVMNAFLNFLTQKNVNGIDLSHVRVVAATNIGNYTFEPDTNILSRFCMFYVVNRSFANYIKNNKIINNYKDECPREGVIFDPRSLKPRCQEELSKVASMNYLFKYYEGYTNTPYFVVHSDPDINAISLPYFERNSRSITISESNATCLAAVLKSRFPRVKLWSKILDNFVNIDTTAKCNLEVALGI
jgi:hypothetical protein